MQYYDFHFHSPIFNLHFNLEWSLRIFFLRRLKSGSNLRGNFHVATKLLNFTQNVNMRKKKLFLHSTR